MKTLQEKLHLEEALQKRLRLKETLEEKFHLNKEELDKFVRIIIVSYLQGRQEERELFSNRHIAKKDVFDLDIIPPTERDEILVWALTKMALTVVGILEQ
jgi:hypothetical protein